MVHHHSIEYPTSPGLLSQHTEREVGCLRLRLTSQFSATSLLLREVQPSPLFSESHAAKMGRKEKKEKKQEYEAHLQTVEEVIAHFETDATSGLPSADAQQRLETNGANKFDTSGGKTWYGILATHTFNFMNLVLLVAMALSFVVVSFIDAGVVIFVIITNALIGFSQEWSSEKTMASLRNMSTPTCQVIRDGQVKDIESTDLVVGDIVVLESGRTVPADLRVTETNDLETDEAMLTGESDPVVKTTTPLTTEGDEIPLGDRKNMMYMSSGISKGKGRGVVIRTGNSTEIGKIAKTLTKSQKGKTPLQKRLDRLGILLCIVAVICIAIVLLTGWGWRTFSVYPEGLRVAVATAVAVIPQSIVVVVTLTLTVGIKAMAKRNALVRKLQAVETVGNVMHVCSDKTGTLTEGKMMATNVRLYNGHRFVVEGHGVTPEGDIRDEENNVVDIDSNSVLRRIITIASLCNMATVDKVEEVEEPEERPRESDVVRETETSNREKRKERKKKEKEEKKKEPKKEEGAGGQEKKEEETPEGYATSGSPTEVALVVLGMKAGLSKGDLTEFSLISENPFDSTIKRMSTVYNGPEGRILFIKGAPDFINPLCVNAVKGDELTDVEPLDDEKRQKMRELNKSMASEGLRVLSLAFRIDPPDTESRTDMEQDCTFVGLIGIRDPPREGVPEAIATCHRAGVVVRDHPFTARAIAKQIGILPSHLSDEMTEKLVMTATKFDKLSDEELQGLKSLPLVIARCSPDSKVRMVTELQRRGQTVAMLGDGVNDSPAIKLSDVGIAMGKNGSEVTKEAADIVLLDDNFATVVSAIREGRKVFANIRRSVIHLLCGNFSEALVLVAGVAFSLDPPLTPLQVLWINLITSAPPAFILGTTPAKAWYMDKTKRKADERFFNVETIVDIFLYGPLMGGLAIVNFVIARFAFDQDVPRSQGATFAALTMMLMFHAYNCRDLRGHFWRKGFVNSWWLHLSVLWGIGTLFFTFYTPPFERHVFEHRRPDYRNWLVAIATTVLFMSVSEIYKLIKRPLRQKSTKKHLNKLAEEDEYGIYNGNPVVEREQVSEEMKPLKV
ncbi:hypothetical protein PROFUN_08601 [Planoprotostelium fungivorum]|uniref:Cation-transporting P-type ATPase N-terminal domain-containing protein n=1 Tax=Planoprotostelium fungivorum TaxID=1890364 RepID=A0A2P6NJ85_9EUKA|nr:hypothetical protein PROFUN_08601 [Planoprotostelium fungivorum]